MLQVLNEQVGHITESRRVRKPGVLREMSGIFSVSDRISMDDNRNNRLYSESLLQNKIVNSPQTLEKMHKHCLLGEADHPADRLEVRINEVSHRVSEMFFDDGYVKGTIEVLDTPSGRIVDTLCEAGVQVGISSRAEGSLRDEGRKKRVNENDYFFHTFDLVLNPGFGSAILHPVTESVAEKSSSLEEQVGRLIDDEDNISNLSVMENVLRSIDSPVLSPLLEQVEEKISSLQTGDKEIPAHTLSLIENLHRNVESLKEENEALKQSLQNTLSEDLELTNQELEVSEGFLREAEETISRLKQDNSELQKALENSRKFRSRPVSEPKIDESKVADLEEENSSLKSQILEAEEELEESQNNLEFLERRSVILLEFFTDKSPEFIRECLQIPAITRSIAEELVEGARSFSIETEEEPEEEEELVPVKENRRDSSKIRKDRKSVQESVVEPKKKESLFEAQPVKVSTPKKFSSEVLENLGIDSRDVSRFEKLFDDMSSGNTVS